MQRFFLKHHILSFLIHLAAEIQRSVWEEQGPDQHGPWGSWDPCCQGGLPEHHQCMCFQPFHLLIISLLISSPQHNLFWSVFSSPTRRNTKPPRTSGSGRQTGPTSWTLPRTLSSRAMWAAASSLEMCVFNLPKCCPSHLVFITGWVQVRQRDYEGLCDPRGGWQVNPPGSEEQWNEQLCKTCLIITCIIKGASPLSNGGQPLNPMFIKLLLRWNTKTSMRRQRASTWPSRTLLKSSTLSLCAISRQRWVNRLNPHYNAHLS